jgi:hypothetical protein
MATPAGYADCSYELKHTLMTRSAFLTFGCDPTATDPNSVATGLSAAFAAAGSLFQAIDSNVQLTRTRVSLGTDGGEDLVGVSSQVVACTNNLNSPPANCAVLVHKTTARGGRRGRGRMYIPWACTSAALTENGSIAASDITKVNNAVAAWLAAVSGTVGPVVLLHRPSLPGVAHPSTPGPPNNVTGTNVDPVIATQRRRLGR